MKKLLCIINPISGGLDKSFFKSRVEEFCEHNGLKPFFHETTGQDDEKLLSNSINEYSPDLLVACGGDGTINLVATCLQHRKQTIPTAIVPLGSANGMAKDLKIPTDPQKALRLILKENFKDLDVVMVNDRFSIHLSDLGFNANLIRKFEASNRRGKWNYFRHFFSILVEQAVSEYSILVNGTMLNFKAQMVAIANARQYGTGAVVNPKGRPDDGLFEICIFKSYPWYALGGITWRFFTGDIHTSPYVKIIQTTEAVIIVNPEEILQIDGEVIGPESKVEIRISPVKFRVCIP